MNTSVTVHCELSDDQALALTQFVKRVSWNELRANVVDDTEVCARISRSFFTR